MEAKLFLVQEDYLEIVRILPSQIKMNIFITMK